MRQAEKVFSPNSWGIEKATSKIKIQSKVVVLTLLNQKKFAHFGRKNCRQVAPK
jgi:hypothetical protein